jgi:hypothetical protein
VSIVLRNSGLTDSSIAHRWFTVPWPESDRLDGHLCAMVSAMIAIAKVHIWDTGSACFNPPIEKGSGGAYPVLETASKGDQILLNGSIALASFRFLLASQYLNIADRAHPEFMIWCD